MDAIHLLIVEKDPEYGQALAKAISNLHNEFHVTLLCVEELKKSNFDQFQFILVGGYEKHEIMEINREEKIIWLTDEPCFEMENEESENGATMNRQIYKYSKVSSIISNLRFAYGITNGKNKIINPELKSNLIGLISPSGGIGTTSVSISIARELSRYHDKKVLYLNFEEFSSAAFYMDCSNADRSISDFLYYVLEKKDGGVSACVDTFTFRDIYGVEAFRYTDGFNELRKLNYNEIQCLIKVLLDCRRYDFIILDLGHGVNEAINAAISYCSRIAVVYSDCAVQRYKSRILMQYLIKNEIKKEESFIMIMNQSDDVQNISNIGPVFSECGMNEIQIEHDPNSFCCRDQMIDISIHHIFGIGIKKVVEEIMGSTV